MSGGRDFSSALLIINEQVINLGHEVLTPFVVDLELNQRRYPGLSVEERARAIFDEDLRLLQEADVVIFEVSQASTGVGEEIGFLVALAMLKEGHKSTLFLRHESLTGVRPSNLVLGNPYGKMVYYGNQTLDRIIRGFFDEVSKETRVDKERES